MTGMAPTLEYLLWMLLGSIVLPLWLAAGLCDYLAHARTRIAETSGVHESFLHLLQTAQIGVPMLAVLLLQVNALVLALAIAGVVAHTITAYRDIRYTLPLRHVSVFEQFAHAFLIVVPMMALALVVLLHWPALADIWHGGADWTPRWKQPPFPRAVIASVLGASLVLGMLPGLLEFGWTWRAARRRRAGSRQ